MTRQAGTKVRLGVRGRRSRQVDATAGLPQLRKFPCVRARAIHDSIGLSRQVRNWPRRDAPGQSGEVRGQPITDVAAGRRRLWPVGCWCRRCTPSFGNTPSISGLRFRANSGWHERSRPPSSCPPLLAQCAEVGRSSVNVAISTSPKGSRGKCKNLTPQLNTYSTQPEALAMPQNRA